MHALEEAIVYSKVDAQKEN